MASAWCPMDHFIDSEEVFVFLTSRRLLFDRVIPLLFCLASKRVSNTFQNILDFTVLKKNLAFLVINSYVLPRTFLAMNILLK